MTYYSFTVNKDFIDSSTHKIVWRLTGSGEFIIGTKGGVKYFIKRNINVRKPAKGISDALYDTLLEGAKYIEKKQNLIKKSMKGLNYSKDKIVVEVENFWDEDNKYVTVTNYIDKLVDSSSFVSYRKEQILTLFIDSIECINKIHSHKIIHADLKEGNFVFSKVGGKIVPYLIDFDSSFTDDNIPDFDKLVYTDGYQAPEVVEFLESEDNSIKNIITNKIDIFEMGIIFHRLWTGEFISLEKSGCSLGECLCVGSKYYINKKFNVKIGDKNGATLMSLINWMIQKDYSNRPSANDVLSVLRDEIAVPCEFWIGDDEDPFTELWDIHKAAGTLKTKEEIKASGIIGFKRVISGGEYRYIVSYNSLSQKTMTINDLIDNNIVVKSLATVTKCWDEHSIEFVSKERLSELGFLSIEKVVINGKHLYFLTKIDGMTFSKTANGLVEMGLAKDIVLYHPDIHIPWDDHGHSFNSEKELIKMNVAKIVLVAIGDSHKYEVTFIDGARRVLSYKEMKILELII